MKVNLTSEEKVNQWHDGKRRIKIGLCSDDKLLEYYKICKEKGYFIEANKIRSEIINYRNIDVPEIPLGKVSEILTPEIICDYIKDFTSSIGDSGEDLLRKIDGDVIYFSWDGDFDNWACRIDKTSNQIDIDHCDNETFNYVSCNIEELLNSIENNLFGS